MISTCNSACWRKPRVSRNIINIRWNTAGEDLQPMVGLKRFYNARRVIVGIELAQKIHKGQFAIPVRFGSTPTAIWRRVMAA